jgi:hypothetical protein
MITTPPKTTLSYEELCMLIGLLQMFYESDPLNPTSLYRTLKEMADESLHENQEAS